LKIKIVLYGLQHLNCVMSRREDLQQFYKLLHELERRVGGKRILYSSTGKDQWPRRGVYFFFEPGELRENQTSRVVRVGTHALKTNSSTTLWNRLRQHRGTKAGRHPGGGNHRGSVFRLHVGSAIITHSNITNTTWSQGNTASSKIRDREYPIEQQVSQHIGAMPLLWVTIDDPPGPKSQRGYIEKHAIALLSNYNTINPIDSPSQTWLGYHAWNQKINQSGLWNVDHVDESYDPGFLNAFEHLINEM
jgi:hypothetical protein